MHSSAARQKVNFEIDHSKTTLEVLEDYKNHITERTKHHLGYPYNLTFDHAELAEFLKFSINNLGDPYRSSNYGVHSRAFELDVIRYFAELWNIPYEDAWGYITCSGTEGNLHGMWVARECLPHAPVYFSSETHYSIAKSCGFYKMQPCVVECKPTGEMVSILVSVLHLMLQDVDDFRRKLLANKQKGIFTAIVNVNCGTTVK